MTTPAKIEANRRNAQLSTGPRTAEGKAAVARNATRHGIFTAVPVVPGECPDAWEAHRAGVVESLAPAGLLEVNLAERAALLLWRLNRLARNEAETVGAAVEDAAAPPLRDPSDPLASFRLGKAYTREDQLSDLRRELRAARERLPAVAPAADVCRAWPDPGPVGPVAAPVAETLFGAGYDHVISRRDRRADPPAFGGRGFRRLLGMPDADAAAVAWTEETVRHGLGRYGTLTGEAPDRVLVAVRDALAEKADELVRRVRRLEAEVAAVERLLDADKSWQRGAALLPAGGRDDRIAKYERHLHTLLTSTLHELERLQARRGGEPVPPPAVADVTLTVDAVTG